jgi:hypothetical protein|tara:strand:- start:3502 stop:3714 length:213 start_codon:yes stop_codon:yes gene_type:complete
MSNKNAELAIDDIGGRPKPKDMNVDYNQDREVLADKWEHLHDEWEYLHDEVDLENESIKRIKRNKRIAER